MGGSHLMSGLIFISFNPYVAAWSDAKINENKYKQYNFIIIGLEISLS